MNLLEDPRKGVRTVSTPYENYELLAYLIWLDEPPVPNFASRTLPVHDFPVRLRICDFCELPSPNTEEVQLGEETYFLHTGCVESATAITKEADRDRP